MSQIYPITENDMEEEDMGSDGSYERLTIPDSAPVPEINDPSATPETGSVDDRLFRLESYMVANARNMERALALLEQISSKVGVEGSAPGPPPHPPPGSPAQALGSSPSGAPSSGDAPLSNDDSGQSLASTAPRPKSRGSSRDRASRRASSYFAMMGDPSLQKGMSERESGAPNLDPVPGPGAVGGARVGEANTEADEAGPGRQPSILSAGGKLASMRMIGEALSTGAGATMGAAADGFTALSNLTSFKHTRVIVSKRPWFMVDPTGSPRMIWDIGVIMPLLIYLLCSLPFRLCFENDPLIYSGEYWFEFGIEMAFLLDIVFNFFTGFFVEGLHDEALSNLSIEYHQQSITKRYLKGWLFLDIFSGIPFSLIDLLLEDAGPETDTLSSFKVFKTLRILRLAKLARLMKFGNVVDHLDRDTADIVEDFMQQGSTKSTLLLTTITFKLGFLVHIAGCLWVFVGRSCSKAGINNWLENEMKGPFDYTDTMQGENVGTIYLAAFYYCLTTMTSVGYGDIITRNNSERIITIFIELLGGFVYAMIIASLTSVVTSSDMNASKVAEQLDAVSSFVKARELPVPLGRRIRRHFRQFYTHKSAIDERKIFMEMSASLRRDVSVYLVSEKMRDVKLFQTMNPKLWPRLFPLLNPSSFEQDEVVCTQDDECAEMVIILEGSLTGKSTVDLRLYDPALLFAAGIQVPPGTLERRIHSTGLADGMQAKGDSNGRVGGSPPSPSGAVASESPKIKQLRKLSRKSSTLNLSELNQHKGQNVDPAAPRPGDLLVKERVIGPGDSVNVLCCLKLWAGCVETVVAASQIVECYAINADDFYHLFNHDNEVDRHSFEEIVHQETKNFRMINHPDSPTPFGIPLFMDYSAVTVTVLEARDIIAGDVSLLGKPSSDPYVTIELVDYDSGRLPNKSWYHRTPTKAKTLNPKYTEKNQAHWLGVHLPFETLALRIRVYDEDGFTDDECLGEVYLRLSEIDLQDPKCRFKRENKPAGKLWGVLKRDVSTASGMFKASAMAVESEAQRELAEAQEQMKAENQNILDIWHKIEPTEELKQKYRRFSSRGGAHAQTPELGKIRIRTWVQQNEANRLQQYYDQDEESTIL